MRGMRCLLAVMTMGFLAAVFNDGDGLRAIWQVVRGRFVAC
jgi:hypothetical protein